MQYKLIYYKFSNICPYLFVQYHPHFKQSLLRKIEGTTNDAVSVRKIQNQISNIKNDKAKWSPIFAIKNKTNLILTKNTRETLVVETWVSYTQRPI